jgi:hypothetical protein
MKKAFVIIAALALAGVVRCQAQTTNVLSEEDITLKGKLSPGNTVVTGESLSGNTNNISVLRIQTINGGVTNQTTIFGQVIGSNVISLLEPIGFVDLTPNATTGDKSLAIFGGSAGTATNAVLFISITDKFSGTNKTVNAKFQGIWDDGTSAVSGTAASIKVKK